MDTMLDSVLLYFHILVMMCSQGIEWLSTAPRLLSLMGDPNPELLRRQEFLMRMLLNETQVPSFASIFAVRINALIAMDWLSPEE